MDMKTGDLVLFKGNGLFSKLIMAAPGAKYSHVGMFVYHPTHGLCVFESTSIGVEPDLITGDLINGVQLTKFKDRVKSYDGKVFHRPILGNRSNFQYHALRTIMHKYHGRPYEKSKRELINAELDLPLPWELNKEDDTSLFCSETMVIALRAMRIMKESVVPSNEFTPTDLSNDRELCDGFEFGDIERIEQ